jgi:hypothetical protein
MCFASCAKTPAKTTSLTTPAPTPTSMVTVSTRAPETSIPPLTPSTDAVDIIAKASRSVTDLQTYLFSRTISIFKSTASDRQTTTIYSQAALKFPSKNTSDISTAALQMNSQTSVKLASGQMAGSVIENSVYIDNDTIYIQGLFPQSPQTWVRTPLTQDYWESQNQARMVLYLLQSDNITLLAPQNAHIGDLNTPCDVLQVGIDPKILWDFLIMQPGFELRSPPPGVSYNQIIKVSEMTLWLAQSDGIPVHAIIKVRIRIDPTQLPSLSGTVSTDFNLSLLFSNYNKPVSIKLSTEALAAQELKLQKP